MTPIKTIREALNYLQTRMTKQEARWLFEYVCCRPYAWALTHLDASISVEQAIQFKKTAERIDNGEPFAYVVQEALFFNRTFFVSPAVLIPRTETETLVQKALTIISNLPKPKILDLGTGSGIIAITLALEAPHAEIMATDISNEALSVAKQNAERLKAQTVQWIQSDWMNALPSELTFDVVVSNPPYIAPDDAHLKALAYEPTQALVSPENGFYDLKHIINNAKNKFAPKTKGWLLLEHGFTQAGECHALMQKAGYTEITTWQDDYGNPRVTGGCYLS